VSIAGKKSRENLLATFGGDPSNRDSLAERALPLAKQLNLPQHCAVAASIAGRFLALRGHREAKDLFHFAAASVRGSPTSTLAAVEAQNFANDAK
jgi:hypothetical protein